MPFKPCGKIQKVHDALQVQVDGWTLGSLVIGAADVPKMLNGDAVNVQFVQERPGREPFIGYAGSARISRSGKAITLRIGGVLYTAPLVQVRQVLAGTRAAAILSRPVPAGIIDADGRQARPIDEGLTHSF